MQKALGHSRPEVTARYAHLRDEATRAAFDHVGRAYSMVRLLHSRRQIAQTRERWKIILERALPSPWGLAQSAALNAIERYLVTANFMATHAAPRR